MTDEQLKEILDRHKVEDKNGEYTMQIWTLESIAAAMREAVQKGIDEHEATKRGYVFDKWLIEQRLKTLEAVEKGSIAFSDFTLDYAYEFETKKWYAMLEIINLENGKTTEQLYQEYLNSLKK